MELRKEHEISEDVLPGRMIRRAVGKNSAIESSEMTVGFARYAPEYGPMEPHNHAEETVVVLDAKDGWVRRGAGPDSLPEKYILEKGDVLHFAPLEWHVFEFGPEGAIEALFIYGQVDNIRNEDKG